MLFSVAGIQLQVQLSQPITTLTATQTSWVLVLEKEYYLVVFSSSLHQPIYQNKRNSNNPIQMRALGK